VLDSGWDVFVWAGAESSAKQRKHALLKADVRFPLIIIFQKIVVLKMEGMQKKENWKNEKINYFVQELMDYPRVRLSCIQWEFEGEENGLFKEQFLNWDEAEVQVDIPIEPETKKAKGFF
jgi:hypothetical protein